MKINTKYFNALAKQLDKEIDKNTDIFFREREFILGKVMILEERSVDLIEEKITNEFTIQKIIRELKAFL